MDIISESFAIFLLVFLIIWHFLGPGSYRYIVISIASLLYYAFNDISHLWLLGAIIIISYFSGLHYERTNNRRWAYAGLAAQLSFLIYYKVSGQEQLPLGISFFIFQSMSYGMDLLRGKQVIRSLSVYTAYISFFPQLVSGPICRTQELIPQLKQTSRKIDIKLAATFLIKGYFYKLFIADNFSKHITTVLEHHFWQINSFQIWIVFIGYGWQLYFDFWGYTNIAYGIAELVGVKLPKNFDAPFFSNSISNFWRNWHISLSRWFKDYVYIPLGGKNRLYIALFITFILSGLWHGFGLNFFIWAVFHASILSIEKYFNIGDISTSNRFVNFIFIFRTYILVSLSWVFFRITDINQIKYIIHRMFIISSKPYQSDAINMILFFSIFCFAWEFIDKYYKKLSSHWIILALLLFVLLNTSNNASTFIYYRF